MLRVLVKYKTGKRGPECSFKVDDVGEADIVPGISTNLSENQLALLTIPSDQSLVLGHTTCKASANLQHFLARIAKG